MKELKKLLFVVLAAAFFIGLFILCDKYSADILDEHSSNINPSVIGSQSKGKADSTDSIEDISVEKGILRMVESDYTVDIKLVATGEIMCQNQQLEQAYDSLTGKFSFADGLKYLKTDVSSGDYAITSLGTTLAGKDKGYKSTVYGYCAEDGRYNSPEALAGDLKDAGYTLLSTATNHALDSDVSGVSATIDNLSAAGIEHVGTAKSQSDKEDYILKSNYVKIAVTGYTQDTDEQDLPEDKSYAVNTLDGLNQTKVNDMVSHIKKLQKDNDYVIVMLNFGATDSDEADSDQKDLAQKLAGAGADLIIGTGSRAVKPMEIGKASEEDGTQRSCTVFYGLGSIYSSDYYSEYENLDTDISLILSLNLSNSISGNVKLTSMEVKPVYLNWYNGLVQPLPVCEAKDSDHFSSVLDEDDMTRINASYKNTMTHFLKGTDLKSEYDKKTFSYTVPLT